MQTCGILIIFITGVFMEKLKKFLLFLGEHKVLVFILGLSFIFSIFYAFYYQIEPKVDARAYDTIAQNIVNGIGYREDLSVSIENDYAIARVGSVYEYFLAGIYKVFGHSYAPVWAIQALLHSISALLVYLSSLLVFKDHKDKVGISLLSSAIFAFYPDLIEISAMLMTETLYLFFVCLFIYTFFLYMESRNTGTFIILGVVSGIAVLSRPPLLFCLFIVVYFLWRSASWKKVLIYTAIIGMIFTPWTVRNYLIFKQVMPFGIAGNLNFWIGNHVGANGEQEASDDLNTLIAAKQVKNLGNVALEEFRSFVFEHPTEFIKLSLMRVNKYFSIFRPMGFWFYDSGWSQILFVLSSGVFNLIVLVLSMSGFVYMYRVNELSLKMKYLLVFTLATPIILFVTVVETRYRFQIYPLLSLLSAYFVGVLYSQKRGIWLRTLGFLFSVVIVNGLIDLVINIQEFKYKLISQIS